MNLAEAQQIAVQVMRRRLDDLQSEARYQGRVFTIQPELLKQIAELEAAIAKLEEAK
jgi:hypothetical protein